MSTPFSLYIDYIYIEDTNEEAYIVYTDIDNDLQSLGTINKDSLDGFIAYYIAKYRGSVDIHVRFEDMTEYLQIWPKLD